MLLYKEEIEVILRTPGYAGFSLLDLHDYPGQGTALVGPLDPFWDSKGIVTPEVHRRYCGPTVPLLRLKKRTFSVDERLTAAAEIAHFGPRDFANVHPEWSIKDSQGQEIAAGSLAKADVPTGKLTSLGTLTASLVKAAAPCKLRVSVSLSGTPFNNDWNIWVYPSLTPVVKPADLEVVDRWSDAKMLLAGGKRVLLFPEKLLASQAIAGSFLPVFWSPIWFPGHGPQTMSILCNPKHPALARFPTDFYSDWQWYDLLQNSQSIILDDTPTEFCPIVQIIDNFSRNHKLGSLFEARVGRGRLLVCAISLRGMADSQPAARQLLASLYAYAGSSDFQPACELDAQYLESILIPLPSPRIGSVSRRSFQ